MAELALASQAKLMVPAPSLLLVLLVLLPVLLLLLPSPPPPPPPPQPARIRKVNIKMIKKILICFNYKSLIPPIALSINSASMSRGHEFHTQSDQKFFKEIPLKN
jgi:hypothetical protein